MGAFLRGIRNVYRAKLRSGLIIAILGLSFGIAVTMTQAGVTVGEHARTVAAQVQTLLEIRAAGATGMGVGADALPEEFFDRAQKVHGISSVEKYLFTRMIDRNVMFGSTRQWH